MRLLGSHNHDHRRAAARVRFGVGVWLLALACFALYSGYWWGALLLVVAVLHFYLGYRLLRGEQS